MSDAQNSVQVPSDEEVKNFRHHIRVRVEEMGYEYPAHSWQRQLCFLLAQEIR